MNLEMAQSLAIARIHDSVLITQSLLQSSAYVNAVVRVAEAMTQCLRSGNKILFFGNGGSAADAQHLAAELSGRFLKERPGLPGWALTTNPSTLTAIGNDYTFDEVFARQIQAMGSSGDIAFAISTSGNSPNVLRGVEVAREKELVSIALTGNRGGRLGQSVDHSICVPAEPTPRIQEAHILTGHILCELIDEAMFGALREFETLSAVPTGETEKAVASSGSARFGLGMPGSVNVPCESNLGSAHRSRV
jgi:D-sedoheptulose 7-phosphate isomerase